MESVESTGSVSSQPSVAAPRDSNRVGVIYGLSCQCHPDDGIRYIGQTRVKNPLSRFREHLRVAASGKKTWQAVYEWIPEHGAANISFVVIEPNVPVDQLDYHESFHIAALCGAGQLLMNQDQFWWIDAVGVWQHTYPTHAPFDRGLVSHRFVVDEFARGIYPLTLQEFRALFPGVERQTADGLSSLLTPEGGAEVALWRDGRPDLREMQAEEAMGGKADFAAIYYWARRVRAQFQFPTPERPREPSEFSPRTN